MASKGYVASILNQLPSDQKKALQPAFDHVLDDFVLGSATKAANFRWVQLESTTAATANEEFSIAHGLGVVPTWMIPALRLDRVNSQLVPLTVSRAPDEMRIYLKSASTGVVFRVFVEY
jgi:hypothetical protein